MIRFPLTIFLSAFLLFQVQPLIAKYILPWFGGGPAVWTACMLFFQLLLLAGYGYAHYLSTRFPGRVQAGIHLVLLAASLLFLPIAPSPEIWKPIGSPNPTRQIFLLLLVTIGLPYLVLSATSPLLQRWLNIAGLGVSAYRLYALSNAGSLLALLSYPILVEPVLKLSSQVKMWSGGYVVFVVLCAWCAFRLTRGKYAAPIVVEPQAASAPSLSTMLFWLGQATCGSVLLLATTNQMCQEVAVAPFLWILPLALYLITLTICFGNERRYDRRRFALLVGVMVPVSSAVLVLGLAAPLWVHIAVYSVTLFACCMTCHGELVSSKPHPRYLTLFYLVVATGGALGGIFVALIAPRLFADYREFQLALVACCLLTLAGWYRSRAWVTYQSHPHWVIAPMAGLVIGAVAALATWGYGGDPRDLATYRNFYGILRVSNKRDDLGPKRVLTHGRVTHGFQYLEGEKRLWPTSYFGSGSGIGLAMEHYPRRQSSATESGLSIGVIGLGVATIAAYGRPGDSIRFYEINPDDIRISDEYFTYRKDSRAKIEVELGDARVRMEQEAARHQFAGFDVLAIDAFTSDAIPAHLLTAECAELYRAHLKADGLLLFHITNKYVDLTPVMRGLALHLNWNALRIESNGDAARGISKATWMILTNNRAFLENPAVLGAATGTRDSDLPPLLWTDDFAGLWKVLKF